MKTLNFRTLRIVLFILLAVTIGGCNLPLTPKEIFEKYNKSVVLITTEYYYELDLGNGFKYWFTNINKTYTDEAEAKTNRNSLQGTGFIISKEGHIATNRHVASPSINAQELLNNIENKFLLSISENNSKIANLENDILFWSIGPYIFHTKEESDIRAANLQVEKQALLEENKLFTFDKKLAKVNLKSKNFISFNGSNLENESEYHECALYKVSENENVDLAVLKMLNSLPENIEIIDYSDDGINNPESLNIQSEVFMISYNLGTKLNTANGLSVQFNEGKVMQATDNQRVLYNIPALHGSSGSPVLDKYGNLVAINFAGIENTQGFNFGIPVQYLKMLMTNVHF